MGAYSDYLGYGHRINFTGQEGELVDIPVNHFRNLAQHIYVMITANRPTMEARAINTDYKSLSQTIVANAILDYYMREKKLEECLKKAAEMAIVLGTGYVKLEWNATAGEAYDVDPDTGEFNYEGEVEFSNLSPFDVVYDGTKECWNNEWILTRTFQNRYNLMAKYPEYADKIKGMSAKNQSSIYRLAVWSNDETDDIPVYEFYHKRTEALPDGRYLLFLDGETVLLDTKMPYRVIPVFRIVPSEILGTPYGYTPMFDIFPIQEAINSLYSTILTNQNAFGVQNVYVPRGADLIVNNLEGAMNIIEANAKPEPLNLTNTPPEVFKYLEMLIQTAETLSGVNSVARGNPEASLKSGNALALVQSMALQFTSGLQQSYVKLIEDVGTALIQILKDFANTPKTVALVGKHNKPLLQEFTGESISSINRVVVDVGNPLSRTVAGRVQMAEQMLQMKLIKTPQEYFQVINTGELETMYEGDLSQLMCIRAENERLMEGKPVRAVAIDLHSLHIKEHQTVIADPDLRADPALTQNVLDHIQEHINLLRTTSPDLLQMIGEQPLQPPPPPGMGPPPMPPGPPMAGPMPPAPPMGPPIQMGPPPGMMPPHGTQHPQHGNPPSAILRHSPMGGLIAPNEGLVVPGQEMVGPNIHNVKIPAPARPPGQFKNLPISPQEMIPPKS